jgi:enoyl-[acyl-carrier protein] reductase I
MEKTLKGKVAVICGVANEYSIAWAIAKKLQEQGAELVFTYQGDKVKERVENLVTHMHPRPKLLVKCDVTNEVDIYNLGKSIMDTYGKADILVHSLAYAAKEDLQGDFLNTSRAGFALAHDISAYSLIALARTLYPAFQVAGGGSIMYMTYYGSEKAISNYKLMGVAKAALEATGMYLAQALGKDKIRVNGISAGPIKTLAARGISNFSSLLKKAEHIMPLPDELVSDDVAGTALYLASELSASVTGEIIHVDKGFHTVSG